MGPSASNVPGRVGPTPLLLPAKQVEPWARRNSRLIRSGGLDVYVDRDLLVPRPTGEGAGKGRPFPEPLVALSVLVGTAYHLPLRQAQGFLESLVALLGLEADVPTYSTVCRRHKFLDLASLTPGRGAVVVVDSTGVSQVHPSMAYARKVGADPRRGRYVKLHLGVDPATGEVTAAEVTPSEGPGTGDVSVGPGLVRLASPSRVACGDRAYDAKEVYKAARESGAVALVPPKATARRGLDPDRDVTLTRLDRLGTTRWRRAAGYGQRAQVESVNSVLKRRYGEDVRARTPEGRVVEVMVKVTAYNRALTA